MKRPFFFLAIFISVLIWAANFFLKDDCYRPEHILHFAAKRPRLLAVDGIVSGTPALKHTTFGNVYSFLVEPKLVRVSGKWFPACGVMSVTSGKDKEPEYGENILFEAAVRSPSEDEKSVRYAGYLKKKGIFALAVIREKDVLISLKTNDSSSFMRFAYKMKTALNKKINKIFSVPARYFMSALILGDRQNISREWKNIFVNTQTIHLLAISGLHVGIISFIVLFLVGLLGLPRNIKYLAAMFLILFYSIMVGWMPSVARSAIMGMVILSAYILKRNTDVYNLLGLAACVILVFQPNQLFDMGFILSFSSILSLVYIYPKLNKFFGFDKIDRHKPAGAVFYYVAALFSASLAVWFGLFPIILYFFNLVSVISIIVNIFAIPCMFVIMPLAISAIIFQPFLAFLGMAFKEATELFLAILLSLLDFCSKIPLAYFNSAEVSVVIIPLYYFIIFLVCERNALRQNP